MTGTHIRLCMATFADTIRQMDTVLDPVHGYHRTHLATTIATTSHTTSMRREIHTSHLAALEAATLTAVAMAAITAVTTTIAAVTVTVTALTHDCPFLPQCHPRARRNSRKLLEFLPSNNGAAVNHMPLLHSEFARACDGWSHRLFSSSSIGFPDERCKLCAFCG